MAPDRTPPHLAEPRLTYATEEGSEAYLTAIARGFHQDYEAEHWEAERKVVEWDRCFGFTVDDRWVATCGAYSRTMTLPGGAALPVAAVSIVTVSPPYRRRGLLTQMMKHQLEDVQRRGQEPVALLWASESLIYGRFGYGHCTPRLTLSGPTRPSAFLPTAPPPTGSVDEVSVEEFRAAAESLHTRLLADRPGALNRTPAWWDIVLYDPQSWRQGASAYRYALHLDDAGQPDGYAVFRLGDGEPGSRGKDVKVADLDAADAGAYAALWRYLLDLDLVASFSKRNASVDEPLRYLVADQRAIKTELTDGTYARLVDLRAALEARAYAAEVDVVLRVDDALLPANDGVWRLEADRSGARVTESTRAPDISLATRELGAGYLGGTSLNALHRTGLVQEHTAGAVERLGAALSWPGAPFCPDFF